MSGFGGGRACDGCDETVDGTQYEYKVPLPDGRLGRLHVGCSGLWQAELLNRIGREQTPAAMSALILEHSFCLGCISARLGVSHDAVRQALVTIETTLELHREKDGLCRACGRTLRVLWVRLPTPDEPDA
jgi:hypothetical protein